MRLTTEQKMWIGDLCEKASTLAESVKAPHRICWDIDHYGNFNLRLYDVKNGKWTQLASDTLCVFGKDGNPNLGCDLAIDDMLDYYGKIAANRDEERRAKIDALEKELAYLKKEEVA